MKKYLKKIILKPKIAVSVAIVIALAIGVVSSIDYKKTLDDRFAKINGMSLDNNEVSSSSKKDLTLAFATGGRIKTVSVKIGDTVKAGTVLASLDAESSLGAINQASASYLAAQTAYEKLVNGASTPDIAVSQANVDIANTTLENAKQNLIRDISNAYSNVNSAVLSNTNNLFLNTQSISPQLNISGTVQTNGQLVSDINNERVDVNYILPKWQGEVLAIDENNLDSIVTNSKGYINVIRDYLNDLTTVLTLYTQLTSGGSQTSLTASQNSVTAAKTIVDNNYTIITNDYQAVKSAKSSLDQAKASFALKRTPARSEDLDMARSQIQSTQGALQIAEGVYNNTVIIAPVDGKVINVSITAGQIATPNTPAIEILAQ